MIVPLGPALAGPASAIHPTTSALAPTTHPDRRRSEPLRVSLMVSCLLYLCARTPDSQARCGSRLIAAGSPSQRHPRRYLSCVAARPGFPPLENDRQFETPKAQYGEGREKVKGFDTEDTETRRITEIRRKT